MLEVVKTYKKGKITWCKVKCHCGKEFDSLKTRITNGYTSSCGCSRALAKQGKTSNAKTHGQTGTRLWNIWVGMRNRCNRVTHFKYKDYGAKGITVCKEWDTSFEAFYVWSMSNGYADNKVIDKDELCIKLNIHPKKYSPKTCQWVTQSENSRINTGVNYVR